MQRLSMGSRRGSVPSNTDIWGTTGPEGFAQQARLEEAENRKKQFLSTLPSPGVTKLSGWTTDGFKESKIPQCPPACEYILGADTIFVQPASYASFDAVFLMEMNHKYELLDPQGTLLYFAAESLESWSGYPSGKRDAIDLAVTGPAGGFVFEIVGSLKTNEVATVKNESTKFGSIKKTNESTYLVLGSKDEELFRLVKSKSGKIGSYDIFPKGSDQVVSEIKLGPRSTSIAHIERSRAPSTRSQVTIKAEIKPLEPASHVSSIPTVQGQLSRPKCTRSSLSADVYGLKFPPNIDPPTKVLILSSLLLLNFVHFAPVTYGMNKNNFLAGVIYNGLIAVLILGMILIVVGLVLSKKSTM